MLKQLSKLLLQSEYNAGEDILMDQALKLALTGKVGWTRISRTELTASERIGLPGQEMFSTDIFLYSTTGECGAEYYFQIGDKKGPCRNSMDKDVLTLGKKYFQS